MSYSTLSMSCNPLNAVTSQTKFIDPFNKTSSTIASNKVKLFDLRTINLNSERYLERSPRPCNKTYNNIVVSYEHYLEELLKKKQRLIEKEKMEAK